MTVITDAVYQRMRGDSELAALLSTYEDGPAIFTGEHVPEDAEFPYVWSQGDLAAAPNDTKTDTGQQIWRDVGVYDRATGSADVVERAAARIRRLFHRQPLAAGPDTNSVVEVSGPSIANTGEDVQGRMLTLRLLTREA